MKAKLYITDEGFGPLVRQSAILEEMHKLDDSIEFTLQTHTHLEAAKRILPGLTFIDKFNNITWSKLPTGSPDTQAIRQNFEDYITTSDAYIKKEQEGADYDFVISDFVYEAFEVSRRIDVPAFGVAHFTWDWFFSKLYPPPLSSAVLKRFFDYASLANVLYFPPFTPKEILSHYNANAKEVPLVVRMKLPSFEWEASDKFRVLIMDSGSGLLGKHIQQSLEKVSAMDDIEFFVSENLSEEKENVKLIDSGKLFVDYIPHMDLVIGRAGFNTISECIAYRVPMLLISEAENPEMNENIMNIKYEGLGSFISLDKFREQLSEFLPKFIQHEYPMIQENMNSHEIRTDGAKVVAQDILNRVKG